MRKLGEVRFEKRIFPATVGNDRQFENHWIWETLGINCSHQEICFTNLDHSFCADVGIHQWFPAWHLLQNLCTLKSIRTLNTDLCKINVYSIFINWNGTVTLNLRFLMETLVSVACCLPPKFKTDIYISLVEHITSVWTLSDGPKISNTFPPEKFTFILYICRSVSA